MLSISSYCSRRTSTSTTPALAIKEPESPLSSAAVDPNPGDLDRRSSSRSSCCFPVPPSGCCPCAPSSTPFSPTPAATARSKERPALSLMTSENPTASSLSPSTLTNGVATSGQEEVSGRNEPGERPVKSGEMLAAPEGDNDVHTSEAESRPIVPFFPLAVIRTAPPTFVPPAPGWAAPDQRWRSGN